MTSSEKKIKKGHTYRQWIFCLLANCTLLAYGMDCGWISPTTKILQSPESPTGEPVSDNTLSWIASSMSIAAIFGVSIYMYISDVYGRKCGVILIAVPQALSWIIRLSYSTATTLIIGRVLVGLSAGGCFSVIPIYVKEISQDDIRGVLGTLVMLLQTSGLLAMYILGTYLSYFTVMFIVLIIPIVVTVLFIKAPESPAFLVKQGKYDEATETVAHLRGLDKDDKIVHNIIENIKSEEELFKSMPNITLASILREKPWRRGLLLISATFIFHGVNGAYAIITFASTILISTGVKFEISPEVQTFSFPIFMIVGALSLAACVEKCGRKPLLVAAFLITAFSMAVIAISIVLQDKGWNIPSWLPVIAIILAVSMFGAGVSPLPFIIMTEMFSFQIRAKITAIAITIAWTMTSVLVITYTPLATYIGSYAPFVFYAVINFLGSIFTLLYIPETKAKTEAEITLILAKGKNEATETVAHLRGLDKDDKIVHNIIENIKSEEELFKSMPNITLASILREKPWRRGLLLISATFIFHGVNGAYAIITFASTILISTGVKFEISPEVQTFSFPIFMIVGALSLAACVEKCGRKPLLVAAFLITAFSMAVIAISIVLQDKGWNIPSWLPVIAIILAVSMFGAGVSPLPFIIMTEMFSFQIRAKITAIAITIAWTMTSVLVITYTPLATYIGSYAPFVFYAVINFLGSIFTLLYIPETKAKTEAEITLILAKGKNVKTDAT